LVFLFVLYLWYNTRLRTAPQPIMPSLHPTPIFLFYHSRSHPWASNTRDCAFQLPIKNESICPEGCPLHRQCE
jgi:hypothetical protein